MKRIAVRVILGLVALSVATFAVLAFIHPRADRSWVPQHAVMTHAELRGDSASLHRLRNFTYTSLDAFSPGYDDRRYDLTKLETVWFIVTPFSKHWRGPAGCGCRRCWLGSVGSWCWRGPTGRVWIGCARRWTS